VQDDHVAAAQTRRMKKRLVDQNAIARPEIRDRAGLLNDEIPDDGLRQGEHHQEQDDGLHKLAQDCPAGVTGSPGDCASRRQNRRSRRSRRID
jgi:hypothetical protein